jgi:hypothetical protein
MSKLTEGLDRHALEHLVMPLVTIDEYESKIDDRRVVVTGFYVTDHDPAIDLSIFIEKSSIRPLDTDVSPAPTDDGYYLVFVEMTRNDEYPTRVVEMCEQVSNLTANKQWQFHAYGMPEGEFEDLSEDHVRARVNLDPSKVEVKDEPVDDKSQAPATVSEPKLGSNSSQPAQVKEPQPTAEQIGDFLANSLIESVEVRGDWLRISDSRHQRVYRIADYKSGAYAAMPVFGFNIGSTVLRESIALQRMLGSQYFVDCADEHVTISDGDNHLILAVDG